MGPSQFDEYPALTPPPGVKPNFINPYTVTPVGRIIIYVTLPLMLIVLAMRAFSRARILRASGADDWLCYSSAATNVAYCGVLLFMFSDGYLGPHQWNVRLTKITPKYVTYAIVTTCLYSASAMFLKTSLLVFYLRIFRPSKAATILIWIGMVVIPAFYLICIIIISVFCNAAQWPAGESPLEFAQSQAESNCNRPEGYLSAVQGVFGTVSDIYVLLIPLVLVSGLQLSKKRRIGLIAVFSFGVMAIGCSIATIYFRFKQLSSADFTWTTAIELTLGALELNVGVICASMPSSLVIFKSFKGQAWRQLKSYFKASRNTDQAARDSGGPRSQESPQRLQNPRPELPGRVISGLKTFVRGGSSHRSIVSKSVKVDTEMSTYSSHDDTATVEEEYHRQLRIASSEVPP